MYIAGFAYRPDAADATDDPIFGMRVPTDSTKKIHVRRLIITVGFDDTTGVDDKRSAFALTRYAAADVTGGASPVRANTNSSAATSCLVDAAIKAASTAVLGEASITYGGNFHYIAGPTSNTAAVTHTIDFDDFETNRKGFVLQQGEGLAIRTAVQMTVGNFAVGSIWWDEVPL